MDYGFKLKVSIRTGLRKFFEWYKSMGRDNNMMNVKKEWGVSKKEVICHQHWGQGIVRSVSFKSKDVYEISVEFLDGVTRVFLFPNINDNLFRFMNDNSQHQLNTMIKRRKKKISKSQRTA